MEYEAFRQIEAGTERVWSVLADVEAWPEWTTSATSVRMLTPGPLALGSEVRIKQPRMPAATWRVTHFRFAKSFTWVARVAGVTTFAFHRLITEADGTVTARSGIEQRGPLSPAAALLFAGLARRYVETELAGLKRLCERPVRPVRRR